MPYAKTHEKETAQLRPVQTMEDAYYGALEEKR